MAKERAWQGFTANELEDTQVLIKKLEVLWCDFNALATQVAVRHVNADVPELFNHLCSTDDACRALPADMLEFARMTQELGKVFFECDSNFHVNKDFIEQRRAKESAFLSVRPAVFTDEKDNPF